MRYVSHTVDGSLKRMANSKTMNVAEVTEFLSDFRKIMKHFKLCGKSVSALNKVLEIMDMKCMLLFCPTGMAYSLPACS